MSVIRDGELQFNPVCDIDRGERGESAGLLLPDVVVPGVQKKDSC